MMKLHIMISVIFFFFFVDNDPEVIFDDESNEFSMPKVFEDETNFCSPVSESLAKFIKMGCTQKADVTKYLEDIECK